MIMNKECKRYKEELLDVFYSEKNMDVDTEKHMSSCEDCQQYWEELHDMKTELDSLDIDEPIEYIKIAQAFEAVENIKGKKKNTLSFILFIVVSSLLLGLEFGLAFRGYGVQILYLQLALCMLSSISLPIIIKMRSLKEGYNE